MHRNRDCCDRRQKEFLRLPNHQVQLRQQRQFRKRPRVNFTKILWEAFTLVGPKKVKQHCWVDYLFVLLRSAHIKAAHKMLMKLTPGCITVWQDLSAEVTGKSGHCCCCCWLLRKELFVMFPFLYKLWTQTWLCEFEIGVPDGCWAENCSTK